MLPEDGSARVVARWPPGPDDNMLTVFAQAQFDGFNHADSNSMLVASCK
jgi:hypothetical protein